MYYISETVFYYALLGSENPAVLLVRKYWEDRVLREVNDPDDPRPM